LGDRIKQAAALTGSILAWCLVGAPAQAVEGAARVLDGQTLEIAGQRFHLQGVVAPALDQVCHRVGKPYPCGQVARAELWELIGGRDAVCTPVADAAVANGAAPATCTAGPVNLNEGMVRSGWALADRATGASYEALEKEAEQAGRGIWRSAFELPGAPSAEAE
jgi:endonuclease YncB( thermonuclease family)